MIKIEYNLRYSVTDVARMFGISPVTVSRWCKSKKINAERTLYGHYRIPKSELKKIRDIYYNRKVSTSE